jgi:hypothetical protein
MTTDNLMHQRLQGSYKELQTHSLVTYIQFTIMIDFIADLTVAAVPKWATEHLDGRFSCSWLYGYLPALSKFEYW